jgi:hypothetical protein
MVRGLEEKGSPVLVQFFAYLRNIKACQWGDMEIGFN